MKKTVQKRAVIEEKRTEIFINRENTVAMRNIDKFKRHTGSAIHGIFVAAGGTKAAVATKRNKFKIATMSAGIHGTPERRIAAA